MAKSRSFFGLRRGSTKSLTFQVNKGQQITKDRVYEVANPRTTQQMAQRLRFACAVLFFKHANQALFKYAFESKRPLESDYNAFIRHNALNAGVVSRYMLERNYPALGNFVLTQGSLGSIDVAWEKTLVSKYAFSLPGIESYEDENATVGDYWKQFIALYPQFEDGDIVTVVNIYSDEMHPVRSANEAIEKFALVYTNEGIVGRPTWDIHQCKIDTNSQTRALDATFDELPWVTDDATEDGNVYFRWGSKDSADAETRLSACAVIVSRPISSSEVKVTTSALICNPDTQLALDVAKSTPWVEWCAETYEDSQLLLEADAILKGEIVESTENIYAVISDPTAKADGRKVATINTASNINPSDLRVVIDVNGSQKRLAMEENWFSGLDVVNYNEKFAGLVNDNQYYAFYVGSGAEVFVPINSGLVSTGSVVAAASASVAFRLVSLSN